LLLIDPESAEERERATAFLDRLVERALAFDGTCTGEHGVGLGKKRFLRAEHGEAVEVMRSLKATLDPLGILNPGKMLPAE
jgi:D-lactate dehydrogenase (cytochrome)